MPPSAPRLLFAALASGAGWLPAQHLVADVVPGTAAVSSDPQLFTTDGRRAYFRATTRAEGSELWTTDGTTTGTRLVTELIPGASGSAPYPALQVQSRLLFWAHMPGLGQEPWSTDGTAAGTFPLAELDPANLSVDLRAYGAVNGRVVFWTSVGRRLVSANLAHPGVEVLAKDLPDRGGFAHQGKLYFTGRDLQLWVTDATGAGTHRLLPNTTLTLRGMFPGGSHMLLVAPDARGVQSLWRTDGTASGTVAVSPMPQTPWSPTPVANGAVFLSGGSLWFCGPFTAPTAIASLPAPYAANQSASLGSIGNRAVLRLDHLLGSDLCTTDGTPGGTHFLPLPGPGSPVYFTSDGTLGYLTRANAGTHSLWVTDGTPALLLQAAVLPGNPQGISIANGRVLLPIAAPVVGGELFVFDPGRGLTLLRDIEPGQRGLVPGPTAALGDRLFFFVSPTTTERQLWVSDGTTPGTRQVVDLGAGPNLGIPSTGEVVCFGGRIVFTAASAAHRGLFATDGTAMGTSPFAPWVSGNSTVGRLHVADGRLWCVNRAERRVYCTDGTPAGTRFLQLQDEPTDYVVVDDLLFAADWRGLTRSDLSPAGTWRVDPTMTSFGGLAGRLGTRVLYRHQAITGAWVIRSTDGTPAGIEQLLTVPNNHDSFAWNGSLWFRALYSPPLNLWRTDGTAAGSHLADVLPSGVAMGTFRPAQDGVYFVGADASEGAELWRCTGQPGGTTRRVAMLPGVRSGLQDVWPMGTGNRLMLAGGNYATGCELFVSDGTPAGTRLLADLAPGPSSSNPKLFGIAGRRAFFLADDGTVGQELWVVDLQTLEVAHVQQLWGGCRDSFGQPRLSTTADPRLGSPSFGFGVEQVAPGTAVVLVKSTTAAPGQGPCRLVPGSSLVSLLGIADLTGRAAFVVPIPAVPALLGTDLVAQAVAFGSHAIGPAFAASDALWVVVGS